MRKLIITVSGKKDAGKTTIANQIAAAWLNLINGYGNLSYGVNEAGKLTYTGSQGPVVISCEHGLCDLNQTRMQNVRIVAFATPLKEFCLKVLGLTHEQCYGTNDQKNSLTRVHWDGLPRRVRVKYSSGRWYNRWFWPRKGPMTGREVMQVFGTDVIRSWHGNAWAHAGYELAASIPEQLVIINDGRFPNEIDEGDHYQDASAGCHVFRIRLMRDVHRDNHPSETALDRYPIGRFDLIIPSDCSQEKQGRLVAEKLKWLFGVIGYPVSLAA
jgi:hypothetical protein